MTREEATRQSKIISRNEAMFNCGVLNTVGTKTSTELVKEIYDDFEKQTCNNCKWYNEPICAASKCEDINELGQYVVRPIFGCNEWKDKIND